MNRIHLKLFNLLVFSVVFISCKADEPAQNTIDKARRQTVERVLDSQNYKPGQDELAASVIRIEKEEYASEKSGKPKHILYKTYRGKQKIKDYLMRDTDEDGQIDLFMEIFYAGADGSISISRFTKEPLRGCSLTMNGMQHISATLTSKDSSGKYDELLLITDDGQFIDLFRLDADGLLQPVNAEEYLKHKRALESIAPIAGAILNTIDSAKGKEKVSEK